MNEAEALAALAGLLQQAKAAVAAGDVAAGEQALLAAIWMKVEPETPTSRALGIAFAALAAELAALVRPEALVGGLNRAGHAFQHAPDAKYADFIITLSNLALAHERAQDSAKMAEMITQIVQLAAAPLAEPDATCIAIFMRWAAWCRSSRQYPPMLVLEERCLRYLLAEPQLPDDTRAAGLRNHAEMLREAGRLDTLRTDLDRAEAALATHADAALSRGLCQFERSHLLAADGDWRGAAELIDSALAAPGLPAREQTELLSLAARAWFKAADFHRASERSRRALRQRVGGAP